MIEICRESPNEARQKPGLGEYEHGRAPWEGPGLVISCQINQGQGDPHRRRTVDKDDQAKKFE
jgi:hypothetical protein